MNVLFYTPVNFRCRDIESLAKKYKDDGHHVFLLTQCEAGALHGSFKALGMNVFVSTIGKQNTRTGFFKQGWELITFCKKYRIDLVFSHLEPTNFVSVIAQYFIRARVVIYRHHVDLARLFGFDRSFAYRLTYKFTRNIVAVSEGARQYMIYNEGVDETKISQINLGYDFSLYNEFDQAKNDEIRKRYPGEMLFITAGNFSAFKRPEISIQLLKKAKDAGIDAVLLFLGKGDEIDALKKLAAGFGLADKVFFLGYVENIMDYLFACDWLIHPSVSEASCVVIKEAALAEVPVMVCKGVGDFDEYMIHEENSVVLDKDQFVDMALVHVLRFRQDRGAYKQMSQRLKKEIMVRFSIDTTYRKYFRFAR